jgi:pimeloyl-ACP methyl ester carboxylesterase
LSVEPDIAAARRIEIAGMSALELGPPEAPVELVFLHANGFHGALYAELLAPLAVGRRIVAPDLRGHGRTRLPADPATVKSWAPFVADVLGMLEEIGGPPVVLAGHSLGASVALLVAARAPERVKALALIEPVIAPRAFHASMRVPAARLLSRRTMPIARSTAGRRRRFASKAAAVEAYRGRGGFRGWSDAALWAYVEDGFVDAAETEEGGEGVVLRCDPAWETAIYVALGNDVWGAVKRASMPLVVRSGNKASTFLPSSERTLRRVRPDADVERIAGVGHHFPIVRPELFRAALERALAAADRAPAAP